MLLPSKIEILREHPVYSIDEVAERVGFSGVEYLSAMFKKKLGVSPRAFRREVSVK
jgi:AraC-like DNA-binding protein